MTSSNIISFFHQNHLLLCWCDVRRVDGNNSSSSKLRENDDLMYSYCRVIYMSRKFSKLNISFFCVSVALEKGVFSHFFNFIQSFNDVNIDPMLFIFFHSFSVGAFHLNIKLMSDDEYSSDAKVFGFNEIMAIMRYMIQFETETTIKTLNTFFYFIP